MSRDLNLLAATAAAIGFLHTLLGPDHYVPFVMMSRAGRWSRAKTTWVTLACGVGHVGSSLVLGLIGIALGVAVSHLQIIESFRGNLAAWALIAFGLIYFIWGVRRSLRNRPHTHWHPHEDGNIHRHEHRHVEAHTHAHEHASGTGAARMTPWVLFTIFVFGPCEPLIPLLMYPAAKSSWWGVGLVTSFFALATLATMLAIVTAATAGLQLLPFSFLERHMHAGAGATISLCGAAILFLGL